MSSLAQTEASRRNGSLSKGPVTPEGKARSAQNAVKHGMYSRVIVLASESPELFDQLLEDYLAVWQPETPQERDLVHDIVIARWRLNRLVTLETASLDHEMDRQRASTRNQAVIDEPTRASLAFNSLADNGRGLALLNRYESRLERTIHRATQALERLRKKRLEVNEKCENEPG